MKQELLLMGIIAMQLEQLLNRQSAKQKCNTMHDSTKHTHTTHNYTANDSNK